MNPSAALMVTHRSNASDLRALRYPSREILLESGIGPSGLFLTICRLSIKRSNHLCGSGKIDAEACPAMAFALS